MHYSNTQQPKKPGLIRRFFRGIWTFISVLRTVLLNLLFLLFLAVIILLIVPSAPTPLPDQFALSVVPSGVLVDQRTRTDPFALLFDESPQESETVVRELVDAINHATNDDRVTALVLEMDYLLGGGISKLEEIGEAVLAFKTSGKPVVAVGNNFTQEQYYLASYADQIYMHEMGAVLLTGYGSYRPYFKSALDKLHINFHVFRVGRYKDFAEPFTRDDMSDESREHNAQWLNQLWGVYTTRVETLRELPIGAIDDYINNLDQKLRGTQGNASQLAIESGLIDGLVDHYQRQQLLIEQFGASPDEDTYLGVQPREYLANIALREPPLQPKVGLLVAAGNIVDGHQPDGTIGSATIAEQLQAVRNNRDIKALVIRIDSGGGSAFASEIIRAELEATRNSGIPVLVSMGSVAASGGYWIAAGSDEIWATPTTITGSIGVFGAFPTFEDSLSSLGIYTDGIGTTELAGAMRVDRPLSPKAGDIIQLSVDNIYQRFIDLVADARGTNAAEIHELAQGRVWSGATAQELGLIDQLGHLDDVIAAAAAHANLENYSVELISRRLSPREMLVRQLTGSQLARTLPETFVSRWVPNQLRRDLSTVLMPLFELQQMNDPRGVYATCLVCNVP